MSPTYTTHQVPAAIQPNSAVQTTGLRASEIRYLQKEFGPNEIGGSRKRPLLLQLLGYLTQPLVAVLLVAAVISAVLGDMVNASIIVVMVLGSIGLDFVQTRRSQQAAERLRSSVAPTATVLRDGQWLECPRRDLVPGNVIALSAGNLVPADAQLLQAKDLHVQQAALTGESMPVGKEVEPNVDVTQAVLERHDLVFLGSSIVSGRAEAMVTATGLRTQFGGIAASLETKPPETEFERGTRAFGFFIMQTILFLVLLVFSVSALNSRPVLESLLFAVALAVGLTPEFLPMIRTITLSNGAIRMARRHVIVKNLASIQNFGAMDVLASDKTGTLTSGEMRLEAHLDASGAPSERVFLFGYLNSLFDTGVNDPHSQAVLARARSNPLDAAILQHDHPDVQPYHKLDELPFDFERRRVSVVVDRSGEHLLITSAPESVLEVCKKVRRADLEQDLNAMVRADCLRTFEHLSAQGARVLAIASRSIADDAKQTAYQMDVECDLTLEGFLSFSDPPLPDANAVLGELRELGVRVVILTGDNELVAQHVCEAVGLEAKRVVLGSELERMTDAALFAVVENASLFARVSPAQKTRVIAALKARGHVIGYVGDGINDAPSLHSADVGISVANAVDVAKDAADMILLEPGLRVIRDGILEGRRASGNVIKYLLMGTSSNFGNMFSMAGAALLLPFLPMLPTQILINNFLYDAAQVTIPGDHVDDLFLKKPRRWDMNLLRSFMLWLGPLSSIFDFLTFYLLLNVLHVGEREFHTGWFIESLATQTLVIFVIRTFGRPWQSKPSAALTLSTIAVVAIDLALPYTPLAAPLGFTPLPVVFYAFLSGATLAYLGIVELVKHRLAVRLGLTV